MADAKHFCGGIDLHGLLRAEALRRLSVMIEMDVSCLRKQSKQTCISSNKGSLSVVLLGIMA